MLDNSNSVDNALENLSYQNSDDRVELENALIVGFTSYQNENLTIDDLLANCDDIINSNNMDDYYYCDSCGELTYYEETTRTENDTIFCNNCYGDNTFYCDSCGRYYDIEHENRYNTEYDDIVCESCYEDHYVCCDECGIAVHVDNYFYDEDTENYFCERCWNNRPRHVINGYYYKPTPIFYGNSDKNLFTGIELEIENKGNCDKQDIANYVINKLNNVVYCKTDGSLTNGFEIVSHPFTLEYLKENKDKVKSVMQYLIENDFRSDETRTCGLHVHVSRNALGNSKEIQDENIKKLFLFFETYKTEICKISRRNGNNYAYFMSDNIDQENKKKKYECLSLEYIKKYNDNNHDRYKVINLCNSNTIEIRIFKGTLNFNTFMATMEFINNLIECIVATETEKITFSKVVNYKKAEYLKEYLKTREIKANYRYLHDYTKYLEILNSKETKLKDNLYKNIMNLGKYIENVLRELLNNNEYLSENIYKFYGTDFMAELVNRYKNLLQNYDNYKDTEISRIRDVMSDKLYYVRQTIERIGIVYNYIESDMVDKYYELENAIKEVK